MLTLSERNAFQISFYEVSKQLKNAKSEAAKEFAEKVKEIKVKYAIPLLGLKTRTEIEDYVDDILMQILDEVDNIVNEVLDDKE